LADFASSKKSAVACDLGTGCGIIPLLLLKNECVKKVVGVEIQTEAAQLAKDNIELNSLAQSLEVFEADLKNLKGILPSGEFDLVTCNPPYKADGAGVKNISDAEKIARHEVLCRLPVVVAAAKHLLKFGGRLAVCHRPERLADIICEMRSAGIEPKVMREVIQREGKEPWLVLVEGRLGGNKGMTVMPPLFVEKNGELSDEMMKIYGDYKQGKGRTI
jgi:tRNA1(Val) A37 N6-methylase TrmN6